MALGGVVFEGVVGVLDEPAVVFYFGEFDSGGDVGLGVLGWGVVADDWDFCRDGVAGAVAGGKSKKTDEYDCYGK